MKFFICFLFTFILIGCDYDYYSPYAQTKIQNRKDISFYYEYPPIDITNEYVNYENEKPKKPSTRKIWVVATAYTPGRESCGKWAAYGKTSTGYKIKKSSMVIAVDPDIIPMGSKVYVPGYGMAIARDTGSAIIGFRIDVLMTVWKNGKSPVTRAREWGVKYMEIEIYE